MGIIAKDSGEQYEQAPTGIHPGICVNVFDIGYQPKTGLYANKPPAHEVVILWELTDSRKKDGLRFLLTKRYTLSLSEKANLRHDLKGWRTRDFTETELKGFDLDNIKKKPCQLNLILNAKNGSTFVNIDSVLPKQTNDQSVVETKDDFIPEWVSELIAKQLPPPSKENVEPPHEENFTDDILF